MLAIEKPSIRLVEVRRVPYVRGKNRVVPPDAVDLERELDGNLHLAREAHHGGSAEALPVHDEARRARLLDEGEGDVASSILEGLRVETRAAKIEGEPSDAFGVVVPRVPAAEEAHGQARARGEGPRSLEIFDPNPGTSESEEEHERRDAYRHGRVLVYARLP
jgi:hypothetical protein